MCVCVCVCVRERERERERLRLREREGIECDCFKVRLSEALMRIAENCVLFFLFLWLLLVTKKLNSDK